MPAPTCSAPTAPSIDRRIEAASGPKHRPFAALDDEPEDKNPITLALWRSLTEPRAPTAAAPSVGDPGPSHPLRARVEAFERMIIAEQFDSAGKNQSETARRLGVSRPALIEKLHKYGLI